MTINELNEKLKKIDYRFCAEQYCGVPAKIVFNGGDIYYFNLHKFAFDGLANVLNSKDIDKSKWYELQDIIIDYFKLKENQTISKEKNGSIMPFEDDISNDSQKKSVLSGLYTKKEVEETIDHVLKGQPKMKSKEQIKRDFIDYLLDHGISYEVDNSPSNIEGINIKNKTGSKVCFIDFTNDKVKQVVVQRAGQVDEKELARLVSLYEQILKMIDGLKHAKEHEDD